MKRTVENYRWKYPAECYVTFDGEDRRETAKRLYGDREDIDLSKSWIERESSHYYAAYKARPKEWWDERRNYPWRYSETDYHLLPDGDLRLCDDPPEEIDGKIKAKIAARELRQVAGLTEAERQNAAYIYDDKARAEYVADIQNERLRQVDSNVAAFKMIGWILGIPLALALIGMIFVR